MPSNKCPKCGAICGDYRNPFPTVDIIIRQGDKVVIIKRKNPPYGWALPGGFIDYGETAENAAIREAKEETNLDMSFMRLFGVYSDPKRDPRAHTMSIVYTGEAEGEPKAQDDAVDIRLVSIYTLVRGDWDEAKKEFVFPYELAFDHKKILEDFAKKYL